MFRVFVIRAFTFCDTLHIPRLQTYEPYDGPKRFAKNPKNC